MVSPAAVEMLCKRRYYTHLVGSGAVTFDPRFLCFEFLSGHLLWQRQVHLVSEFYQSSLENASQAQQMIMGDGKTTVVGPILALMLASGVGGERGRHVTLVCPKALLQQSKELMRAIFLSPRVPKPVYTLTFDRGSDSRVSSLRALREKLETSEKDCGIVVASPTAIKSFFLKYIELLLILQKQRDEDEMVAAAALATENEDAPGFGGGADDVVVYDNTESAWLEGPFTWLIGCAHTIRVSTRPDSALPFVPSRLVLLYPKE